MSKILFLLILMIGLISFGSLAHSDSFQKEFGPVRITVTDDTIAKGWMVNTSSQCHIQKDSALICLPRDPIGDSPTISIYKCSGKWSGVERAYKCE